MLTSSEEPSPRQVSSRAPPPSAARRPGGSSLSGNAVLRLSLLTRERTENLSILGRRLWEGDTL